MAESKNNKAILKDMSGARKAAILLISLGDDVSSSIFKKLSDYEIETLSTEISQTGTVKAEEKQAILEEFYQMMRAQGYISQGGIGYAERILRKAVGDAKTERMLNRVQGYGEGTSFELLRKVEPLTIANFLKNEHVQTIALVLANLDSAISGPVLSKLPVEIQPEVAFRVATMDKPSPDMVKSIEEVLEKHISSDFEQVRGSVGGTKSVADALNEIDSEMWQDILEGVEDIDPEVAQEVKNKMFVFKDLELLDNRSMQEILKEVETKELAVALKAASETIKEKIFSNMSKRAAEGLREEVEYLGPMRLVEVEGMQQRIADVVRRLEGEGRVIIAGRGGATSVMIE
ncbi:MAG: flagellar motor switch protein FliG [Candidatus Krumholzibacteriota bacterium]|nr:flagellar motor switch protein FliG [Candidatus Krumholzibacteriota bacterium]